MPRWLGPADALLQQATWWTAVACAAHGATVAAAFAGGAAVAAHLLMAVGLQWAIGVPLLARAARAFAGERTPAAGEPEAAASAGGSR
jgi:hypothetical protein